MIDSPQFGACLYHIHQCNIYAFYGDISVVPKNKRISIGFFSAVNLENGRGTENIISRLIDSSPVKNYSIDLIESSYKDSDWLNNKVKERIRKRARITLLSYFDDKFTFVKKNILLFILYEMLLRPILLYYQRYLKDKEVLRAIRNLKLDALYVGFNEYVPLLRGLKCPIILSTHNMPASNPFITRVILKFFSAGLIYKGVSAIHTYTRYAKMISVPREVKKLELDNGVDCTLFSPGIDDSASARILYVGYLEEKKGIDVVLNLFSQIESDGFELHIVGDGPLSGSVSQFSEGRDNVFYYGGLMENELSKIYSKCDIFLYPTRRDNYPMVVLQALSAGLYVVVSDLLKSAYNEMVERNFLSFDSFTNIEVTAENIRNLGKAIASLRGRKRSQHDYIRRNFDWSIVSRKFYDFVESLNS